MANHRSVLLVSANPELHQVLEIIAATYSLRFLGADGANSGIVLFKSKVPDCVIFDLEILRDIRQKALLKKKLGESGVPILFLNDSENGTGHKSAQQNSLKLEPIVKFVVESRSRMRKTSNRGIVARLISLCGLRRNTCSVVE